ncbi:MAG: ribonuclease J [Thermoplasmata archaeon]
MKITVFDGSGTIGGNKILVEEKNESLFLDFGMNFTSYSKYFEEFLTERNRRGIYDLWMLNLIPKKNIYRKDLIPNDLIGEIENREKIIVNGVLISHAHLDHVGNIALLNENIPIIASPETLLILKTLSDISTRGLNMEIPFFKERVSDGNILIPGDIKERQVFSTLKLPGEAIDFMQKIHTKSKDVEKKEIMSFENFQTHFEIKPYKVDHSIFGANGFIIEGDISIAYTGDFRIHGMFADDSKNFISQAKNVSILITEGTRVGRREDVNLSENDVYKNAKSIVEEAKSLVVADFSPRNFERLISFKRIADETGRKLIITDKDAYHLYSLDLYDNIDRLKGLLIYDERTGKKAEWKKFLKDSIDNEWILPNEIGKAQENFIICFSFYDINELLDIVPNSDSIYIYSSSEAFGEEEIFSFERLLNWIDHFGMRIEGIRKNGNRISFIKGLHASGHISEEELYNAISEIDPDYIIPIHTEDTSWFNKNFEKKVINLENGMFFDL